MTGLAASPLNGRMRLQRADSDEIGFAARRAPPALLAAVPVALLGLLPLLAPEPSALHVGASIVLVGLALGVGFAARSTRVTLLLRRRRIVGGGASLSLDGARALVLSGCVEDERPRYRLELIASGGARVTLVEDGDPARVLEDLARTLAHFELRLISGWGLPTDARSLLPAGGGEPAAPDPPDRSAHHGLSLRPFGVGRVLAAAVVSTLAVSVGLGIFLLGRLRSGQVVGPLSVALGAFAVAAMALVSAAVASERIRVSVGRQVVVERRVLFATLERRCIERAGVRAVHPVGPTGAPACHLLLVGERSLLAIPCSAESLPALQRLLGPG